MAKFVLQVKCEEAKLTMSFALRHDFSY